ncbi:alpha/beta hydrolase [Salicibibacter cibarius]|uniref:Alpha/beta hydrolase n=1 Tax=Salicibibacter cibarius TaxID=2743000 RepID=A0A7T6Z033_9BACI|nr:alpha/beta hydrolase [Salicibibacter cibarius]QQK74452.1 alpha/beta hydrolase [Salicibibacter cibarius]
MPHIDLGDYTIHYRIEGNGPTLVLLHGMGNNSKSWKSQLDMLKHSFTVIAWDAPGYGLSSDPKEEFQTFTDFAVVLKKFLDAMSLTRVYVLGHSMGAAIALELYNISPNAIKGLILADATRGAADITSFENKQKMNNRLYAINTLPPNELAKQRAKHLLAPNPSEKVLLNVENIMSEVRPPGYRSVIYSLANLDQTKLYLYVNIPTLIICGEKDKVTPVQVSKLINDSITESDLVIIPETGHLCYQEDPDSFNYHVMLFLQKTEHSNEILKKDYAVNIGEKDFN